MREKSDLKLRTKSVATPIEPRRDGLRILVTRFRGRGLASDRYDVWMANLGPSEELLRGFLSGAIAWPQYKRRYEAELFAASEIDARSRTIKNRGQKFTLRLIKELARRGPVSLLCHCAEDEQHCHRHLLRRMIESSRI
jgi:uncharacterized protein YeaO (DUF488 family)